MNEILKCDHSLQMKGTEQYFPVVLYIMLYKVVLTNFEFVDEIIKWDHLNKSYWVVLSRETVYYVIHASWDGSNLQNYTPCQREGLSGGTFPFSTQIRGLFVTFYQIFLQCLKLYYQGLCSLLFPFYAFFNIKRVYICGFGTGGYLLTCNDVATTKFFKLQTQSTW